MGKVSGSYPAVILGVSEQVPQDRRPGQHFEQVNMISDPVRGLCRRQGSENIDESNLIPVGTANAQAAFLADTETYKTRDFFVGGHELTLIYRTRARPSVGGTASPAPAFLCYSKDWQGFIPVVLGSGALINSLVSGGVSALANVGRFLFIAGNSVVPTGTAAATFWGSPNSQKGIAWVRGGAYSRRFTVSISTFRPNGARATFAGEYTTPAASYPGVLDTSDIPPGDDYQRLVNDRTNAYNSAVNAWIGTSAAAIQPLRIAEELVHSLRRNHPDEADAFWQMGSNVVVGFDSPSQTWKNIAISDISVSDGGDGSLIKGVGQTVNDVNDLSAYHHHSKVVEVRPKTTTSDRYYMRASDKSGNGGLGEVVWAEAAGEDYSISSAFAFATVENGTLYIGNSPANLQSLSGVAVPSFSNRTVGDAQSSPAPSFIGRTINYLGLFQDRLVIGAGSTLFFSRPGDYLNWFRKSVLTVADDDPVEIYALGSEDDVIRHDVVYDRNLLLFGERQQYVINGKQPFTPTSASIVAMSTYAGAVDAPPIASGNYAFYAKRAGRSSTVHQIQTGVVVDAPESQELTKQLDRYITGAPLQVVALTSPNTLVFRTTSRHELYVYSYMDNEAQAQRLFDSWSKWTWHPLLGHIVGLTTDDQTIITFTMRKGPAVGTAPERWWIAADRFSVNTEESGKPHLDSQRPYGRYTAATPARWLNSSLPAASKEPMHAAYGQNASWDSPVYMLGTGLTSVASLIAEYASIGTGDLWVGVEQDSFVEPTNPYIRDQNDRAIVNGRLTMVRYLVNVTDTGGMEAYVSTFGTSASKVARMTGRILGNDTNQVGRQPLVETAISVPVGREVRDFRYRLAAVTWLPLTITAIEWVGQYFYNSRRI